MVTAAFRAWRMAEKTTLVDRYMGKRLNSPMM